MFRGFFRATCLFAWLTLILTGSVLAHRWGDHKKFRCSERAFSNSCDFGTSRCHYQYSSSTFPRGYQYHRENGPYHATYNRGRQQCTTLDSVSKIFSTSCYSDVGPRVNSLLRQQRKRVDMTNAIEFPYSFEDYGDAGIELSMELPDVDTNDVSVKLRDDIVVISVRQRLDHSSSFVSQAEFSQSFQLGKDVDLNAIQVTLSSGILIVSIPRKSRVNYHHGTIPIQIFDQNEKQDREDETEKNDTSTEEMLKTQNGHSATESQPPKDDKKVEILDYGGTWK